MSQVRSTVTARGHNAPVSNALVSNPSLWKAPGLNAPVLIVLCVAAFAWLVMAFAHPGHAPSALPDGGGASAVEVLPGAGHPGHGPPGGSATVTGVLTAGLLGVVGWTFMVVAMMLPPALPLLDTVRRLLTGRPDAGRLTYLAALGFVAVWAGVGVVLVTGDLGLRALWAHQGWAAGHAPVVTGAVLVAAGAFQLTPFKDACLRACRSPRSFALAHWRGQRPAATEITAITGFYALSCVGCCWALMLTCFAVGAAALPAMVVLALLMAAERLVSWGRRLVRPAGLVLIVLGVLTALEVSPTTLLP